MSSIVDLMVAKGLVQKDELLSLATAGQMTDPLHRVALLTGLVSEDDFLDLVSRQMDMPLLTALPGDYDPAAFSLVSPMFMEEHRVLPLAVTPDSLRIVTSDPFDHMVVDTLKQLYQVGRIEVFLAKEERIKGWITEHYLKEKGEEGDKSEYFTDLEDVEQLKDLASEAPVIKKVNFILTKAVEFGASDVHIEAFQDRVLVRLRIDGLLHEFDSLPRRLQQSIVTRVKIMSKLDIAERRLPQDGRIFLKVAGKNIDLRVSCLPTSFGESVVMRILDRSTIAFSLESLGFPPRELDQFKTCITQPHGILLVTGPTGSGKTTTLYAALSTINAPDKKIITVEDPVEYNLDGINQVQVNTKSGLTFGRGLRSIVRQDPDVILIGEIRDRETADIAIQSALTGHLVFSTLHTNDAAGAVTRLIEIGVEDYLLSSSLLAIMAQRLVRVLCPHCKKEFVPDAALQEKLGIPKGMVGQTTMYEPVGCPQCSNTGYRGRTGIFELLLVDEEIKGLILENKSATVIREAALTRGMTQLKNDGWRKVALGQTSITEVLRVAGM